MEIRYREGKKEDSYRIAELDNLASDGVIEYLFHDLIPNVSPVQIVASNLENDQYPYTYRNVIIAEHKSEIAGISLSFPAKHHTITTEMKEFFPPDRLEHFFDFFSSRVEGSYFLDALCVDKEFRHKGIGSKLIDLTKNKAQKEGFKALSLIVFADNTEARRLYEKCGFKIIKEVDLQPHELIPHEGGCLLMNCSIEPHHS